MLAQVQGRHYLSPPEVLLGCRSLRACLPAGEQVQAPKQALAQVCSALEVLRAEL